MLRRVLLDIVILIMIFPDNVTIVTMVLFVIIIVLSFLLELKKKSRHLG